MYNFILLKRTLPTSKIERECEGYNFFIENTTEEQRKEWGIDINTMKKLIKEKEKYVYQVGRENGIFKTFSCSIENYELIRKLIFGIADDL